MNDSTLVYYLCDLYPRLLLFSHVVVVVIDRGDLLVYYSKLYSGSPEENKSREKKIGLKNWIDDRLFRRDKRRELEMFYSSSLRFMRILSSRCENESNFQSQQNPKSEETSNRKFRWRCLDGICSFLGTLIQNYLPITSARS